MHASAFCTCPSRLAASPPPQPPGGAGELLTEHWPLTFKLSLGIICRRSGAVQYTLCKRIVGDESPRHLSCFDPCSAAALPIGSLTVGGS